MKIFRSFEDAGGIINPVVTTGSFDGVHIGHKKILSRLKMLADKHHGESVLITFDPHPRKVLYPETAGKDLKLINSQEEKLYLLEKAGLDNVIIVEFTRDFSKITSELFVRDLLSKILKAKVIVAGFNHHFGFNKEGDYKQLWEWQSLYNFEAEEIPEQEVMHETVSSTRIREAINGGYIQRANAYLDHYYIVIGPVKKYESGIINSNSAYFTIEITEDTKLVPSPGVYAISAEFCGNYSKGMAIIQTVKSPKPEILLRFFNEDFISKNIRPVISFHKKVHGAVNLDDSHYSNKISMAMDEISELIY